MPFDIEEYEATLRKCLSGEIDIPPNVLVYSMWSILFNVLNSFDELENCHSWSLDGQDVVREQVSSKKISVEGWLDWMPGCDGGGCTYFQVDIARGTSIPLYSFKLYRGKSTPKLALHVRKQYDGWEVDTLI